MQYMRRLIVVLFFISIVGILFAQPSIDTIIGKLNKNSVEYISVTQLLQDSSVVLLDTRKKEEYDVSHIQNAIWVGHRKFKLNLVESKIVDKKAPIVVYCSIGVRSEDIGEKLLKAGYTNVKNLYGGIFEWKNKGLPVFDQSNQETQKVHAFNRYWGKFLKNAEKVYRFKNKALEN